MRPETADKMDTTAGEWAELESLLGHHFRETGRLERAVTHSTLRQEEIALPAAEDNERLEFLGDAVLGLVVSDVLVRQFPDWSEGRLSKAKAVLVSTASLHAAAVGLQLGRFLRLGRGEEMTGGREKPKLLAGAFEAVLAAIYLDAGLAAAEAFVRRAFLDQSVRDQADALGRADHKSALQDLLQAQGGQAAEYRVVREEGPDHRKTFEVEARVGAKVLGRARGPNKKAAEQAAAELALESLRASNP